MMLDHQPNHARGERTFGPSIHSCFHHATSSFPPLPTHHDQSPSTFKGSLTHLFFLLLLLLLFLLFLLLLFFPLLCFFPGSFCWLTKAIIIQRQEWQEKERRKTQGQQASSTRYISTPTESEDYITSEFLVLAILLQPVHTTN